MSVVTKESLSYLVGDLLELPRWKRYGKAYRIIGAIVTVMTNALKRGETIRIHGLGTFHIRHKAATRHLQYYYPYLKKKGLFWEMKDVPAHDYVHFTPTKPIIRRLNEF